MMMMMIMMMMIMMMEMKHNDLKLSIFKQKEKNSEFQLPANSGCVSGSEKALPETGSVATIPALIPAGPEVRTRVKQA